LLDRGDDRLSGRRLCDHSVHLRPGCGQLQPDRGAGYADHHAGVGGDDHRHSVSRPYGTPNPTFTSTISGALNGDTFLLTYTTPAVLNSPVGQYAINASITGGSNLSKLWERDRRFGIG